MYNKSISILIVIISVIIFNGCLDIDRINIYLTLDKDNLYSGKAKLEFINIHSTSASAVEKVNEMENFYNNYREDVDNIIQSMPLFNYKAEFSRKEKLSADVIITGEFKNILSVLAALMSESSYRVEGDRKKISLTWGNPFTDSTETNLIIQYPGRIVHHNSKNFNAVTGTMKWNMSKTGDREVSFILESD